MQASDKRYFLRGIDYFQLLIDHHNKKKGGLGHASKLAILLKGHLDKDAFLQRIADNEHCRQIARIRIHKTWGLGYPSIFFEKKEGQIPVSFHTLNTESIPPAFFNHPVQVFKKAPLHIQVLYLNNGDTCLLFTFHHILFDFSGVQSFIASLCGTPGIPLLPPPPEPPPFSKRFKAFFQAVAFTFKEANAKMTSLERKLPGITPLWTTYKEIRLSTQETKQIVENCQKNGAAFNQSAYLLACVSIALQENIFSKQKNNRFLWIPVPVNFRKKGTRGAILLNGLSFLFYKLKPDNLSDTKETVHCIQNQMKEQMRKGLPQAFIDFADAYWYVPLPIYYPMFNLPSLGKLSSFSFSLLGEAFPSLDSFMDLPVLDITNFPSNSISPGLTILFYEFRGQMRFMSSWVQGAYTSEEQDLVLNRIRDLLLNG